MTKITVNADADILELIKSGVTMAYGEHYTIHYDTKFNEFICSMPGSNGHTLHASEVMNLYNHSDNAALFLPAKLQAKHDLIIEALEYFENMYMTAKTAKNRKIQLGNLQATKREYAAFCKENNINVQ